MIRDEKNIKDETFSLDLSLKDKILPSMSYTKTHKLITGLYMVTDIMDKEEPLRNTLRTLGLEILSDVSNMSKTVFDTKKIDQVMSFLDISSAMNFISEMNCSILKNEFLALKKSIQESTQAKPVWLEEFLSESPLNSPHPNPLLIKERGNLNSPPERLTSFSRAGKGHLPMQIGTRIGVQKGSTLMKALSDKTHFMSDRNSDVGRSNQDFNFLKKQRRDNIIKIIKVAGGNATITDIKIKNNVPGSELNNIGEKTLQRELISMVKDGVLYKEGEKRWSRYFIK